MRKENVKNIMVLAGGNSGEHAISLQSAETILNHIDRKLYHPCLVVIRGSEWIHEADGNRFTVDLNDLTLRMTDREIVFDAVFNMVHGTPGEDGMLQGYLDMMGMPYTSSGRLAAALTFNKYSCSRYVSLADMVNIADAVLIRRGAEFSGDAILEVTGLPCFVKPNKGGSSVGMSKVKSPEALQAAILKAFEQDDEVLVEAFVKGTEVTCGVFVHGGSMVVLPLTEIVSHTEYFDYEAKYQGKSEEITPARITEDAETDIKRVSAALYRHLQCRGVVRFDYILSDQGLFFLEVNSVPGMSEKSIVPQQLQQHGMDMTSFLTAMIEEVLS